MKTLYYRAFCFLQGLLFPYYKLLVTNNYQSPLSSLSKASFPVLPSLLLLCYSLATPLCIHSNSVCRPYLRRTPPVPWAVRRYPVTVINP